MQKKYFLNLFIVLGTALLAGCSALVGAYSDNPYGPVVNRRVDPVHQRSIRTDG